MQYLVEFLGTGIMFVCKLYTCTCCFFLTVYGVLEELKSKQYHSQMDRYLQLFHHRPIAAALYKKVCIQYAPSHTCGTSKMFSFGLLSIAVQRDRQRAVVELVSPGE